MDLNENDIARIAEDALVLVHRELAPGLLSGIRPIVNGLPDNP